MDGALVYSKLSAVTVNFGREPWQSILTCLPPRVHNDTPLLSHHLMIPMPCLGVNWFTNYKKKNKKVTLNADHSTEFENITDFLLWKHNEWQKIRTFPNDWRLGCPKSTFLCPDKLQRVNHLVQKNHRKVLLSSFYLNSHTSGFQQERKS